MWTKWKTTRRVCHRLYIPLAPPAALPARARDFHRRFFFFPPNLNVLFNFFARTRTPRAHTYRAHNIIIRRGTRARLRDNKNITLFAAAILRRQFVRRVAQLLYNMLSFFFFCFRYTRDHIPRCVYNVIRARTHAHAYNNMCCARGS